MPAIRHRLGARSHKALEGKGVGFPPSAFAMRIWVEPIAMVASEPLWMCSHQREPALPAPVPADAPVSATRHCRP